MLHFKGGPNGIVVDGDRLTIVTFGSGVVTAIDGHGELSALPKPAAGNLDGLLKLDRENKKMVMGTYIHGVFDNYIFSPYIWISRFR